MQLKDMFPSMDGRKGGTRGKRLLNARLIRKHGGTLPIVIRNISRSGLGAMCSKLALLHCERVKIVLPTHVEVSGIVRWVNGRHFGVELTHALDVDLLASQMRILHELKRAEAAWDVGTLHRVHTPRPDKRKTRTI